jgi:hypothetical protein
MILHYIKFLGLILDIIKNALDNYYMILLFSLNLIVNQLLKPLLQKI